MSDLLGVATLIGVLAAVFGLLQVRKARRRAFEDMYVQRYWTIMDRLSTAALESTGEGPSVSDEDRRAVIAYLRLSEDELDLRCEGWVSKDTWELWWDGICTQLRRWPFDMVWNEVYERESGGGDEEGQFKLLRAARKADREKRYDPRTVQWWRSWGGR